MSEIGTTISDNRTFGFMSETSVIRRSLDTSIVTSILNYIWQCKLSVCCWVILSIIIEENLYSQSNFFKSINWQKFWKQVRWHGYKNEYYALLCSFTRICFRNLFIVCLGELTIPTRPRSISTKVEKGYTGSKYKRVLEEVS